jgi:hypothetical protein
MDKIFNTTKITESGIVVAEPCIFGGFFIGTDEVNHPVITVYDNASAASGEELVPSNKYDATLLGLNGAIGFSVLARNGIYVEITTAGACEVTVLHHLLSQMQINRTQLVL